MGKDAEKPTIVFDPEDTKNIRHVKKGPVDYYEDISARRISLGFNFKPAVPQRLRNLAGLYQERHNVTRMFAEIVSIDRSPGGMLLLVLPLVITLVQSFLPALTLWYNTQFLKMVETAIEKRSLDQDALIKVAIGRCVTALTESVLQDVKEYLETRFNNRVERHFDIKKHQLAARLDVPTFSDPQVWGVVEDLLTYNYSLLWSVPSDVAQLFSMVISFFTSLAVLMGTMREHSSLRFILVVGLMRMGFRIVSRRADQRYDCASVYKTTDKTFVETQGVRSMLSEFQYRRDIVSGGLTDFLATRYEKCVDSLGDHSACSMYHCTVESTAFLGDWDAIKSKLLGYVSEPLESMSTIYTCLQIVNSPSRAPLSLATLRLVEGTVESLIGDVESFERRIDVVIKNVKDIGAYFNALETPNKIEDGKIPFPENQMDVKNGISVEFKNVSFKYSKEDENMVLKNISFKIEQGQLCVIVGENGTGKSTILTLMSRIYDVTEGQILLNGIDMRKLKLADVRKAIAILSQDYTIFPYSFAGNIGLGDPDNIDDMEKIRQAAKLGGAEEFIEALPHKFDTFLYRPTSDFSNSPSEESPSIFAGKKIDFSKMKLNSADQDLSGGQKQRIAVSRTFMKAVVTPDNPVGLLLFDEPSASLDPRAEHDLFSRLRELRGNKTMVFSTHRFGKLTRHADLILYIQKGEVLEAGTHETLMKKEDGEYAKFWNLQAQDFI